MSSAVHFPCQISTVIISRGLNASPPTEHALMLIYTFSSVQYGGLVSNGPTVPWNIITCLFFTDLQRKKEQKDKKYALSVTVFQAKIEGYDKIYKACAPNHTTTLNH